MSENGIWGTFYWHEVPEFVSKTLKGKIFICGDTI
jgi:hypothetical protein